MDRLEGKTDLLLPLGVVFLLLGVAVISISGDSNTVKKAGALLILAGIGLGLAWYRFNHPVHH